MRDNVEIAKDYTDWMVKTGGYARDMTMRDHFAALAMQVILKDQYEDGIYVGDMDNEVDAMTAINAYIMADAMLKERAK
jgi:hypothetical protein